MSVSLFMVMLVGTDGEPVLPPFVVTFPGTPEELGDELADVFADEPDVTTGLIVHLSDDPGVIADSILASDPFASV